MEQIRIGIVGVGYWGEKLLRLFGSAAGVRLAAACDSHAPRLAAIASFIPTCQTLDELLERSDVDAVVIATPPSTHHALARQVLRAGRHCWVEKPLALRSAHARELVALASAAQRILFVDETFLYDPLVQQAKRWIDEGRLGKLFHLSFERLGLGRIRRDSDVWWNSAPHDLSLLCHLVPAAVEHLHVEGFSHLQNGIADVSVATLRLQGGISAHVHLSWLSPLKVASVIAVGSAGMLHYEGRFGQRALRFFDYALGPPADTENSIPIDRFAVSETLSGGSEEPLALAVDAFVASIRSGIPAPSAGEYSQRVVELLEAAER